MFRYEEDVDPHAPAGPARAAKVIAIGNFDGVHRGHQAVLASVAGDARGRGLEPAVLTFSPHPRAVLGRPVPPLLTSLPRKAELIRRVDPAIVLIVQRFDLAFAGQSPESFARALTESFHPRVVVVGHNFRFGKDRAGDFDELTRLGVGLGFETRSTELVGDEGGAWSSSLVRAALARGDLDEAARMLGRPHMISGSVVQGDRRGRTIGFPTCNLAGVDEALPPFGVYAVLVDREKERAAASLPPPAGAGQHVEPFPAAAALATGVANIGVRPTVKEGETRPSVEVHLFDTDADLYGARLRVHLVARLRAEQRFDGLDALKAQIARDAAAARERLAGLGPDAAAGGAWR
jgi:riboflavin kinase / FMN adenylyltransferase